MTGACKNYYDQLYAASGNVLTESFSGSRAEAMAKSHAFIDDLALWINELGARPEISVLEVSLKEYQFALFALSAGHYRACPSSNKWDR
jgi:hypothetical protein